MISHVVSPSRCLVVGGGGAHPPTHGWMGRLIILLPYYGPAVGIYYLARGAVEVACKIWHIGATTFFQRSEPATPKKGICHRLFRSLSLLRGGMLVGSGICYLLDGLKRLHEVVSPYAPLLCAGHLLFLSASLLSLYKHVKHYLSELGNAEGGKGGSRFETMMGILSASGYVLSALLALTPAPFFVSISFAVLGWLAYCLQVVHALWYSEWVWKWLPSGPASPRVPSQSTSVSRV